MSISPRLNLDVDGVVGSADDAGHTTAGDGNATPRAVGGDGIAIHPEANPTSTAAKKEPAAPEGNFTTDSRGRKFPADEFGNRLQASSNCPPDTTTEWWNKMSYVRQLQAKLDYAKCQDACEDKGTGASSSKDRPSAASPTAAADYQSEAAFTF